MKTQHFILPAAVAGVVILALLAFTGVSISSIAPFTLILLVCPLMMFFMMRGMGHGGGHSDSAHAGQSRRDER